jgi:hypothetical protein
MPLPHHMAGWLNRLLIRPKALFVTSLPHSRWKDVLYQSAEMLLRYCWDVLPSIHVRKNFSFNVLDALLRLLRCFFN